MKDPGYSDESSEDSRCSEEWFETSDVSGVLVRSAIGVEILDEVDESSTMERSTVGVEIESTGTTTEDPGSEGF